MWSHSPRKLRFSITGKFVIRFHPRAIPHLASTGVTYPHEKREADEVADDPQL